MLATRLGRGDTDLDALCVRRRPRSSGLEEFLRRRVMRSRGRCSSSAAGDREPPGVERLLCFALSVFCRRDRDRDRDRDRFVEMVLTESALAVRRPRLLERLLFRPRARASSFFFRISSAVPFLRTSSVGTSVVSAGLRVGLRSCCVRLGRDL